MIVSLYNKKMHIYEQRSEHYEKLKHLKGSIIVIEASIGAGKTTLGKRLSNFLNEQGIPSAFFPERVNITLLKMFLSDTKKYGFMFQVHMLSGRQTVYAEALALSKYENKCCIIDRGYIGDYAFGILNREEGRMNTDEWNSYIGLLESIPRPAPTKIVYLDVSPDVCMDRIKKRDRPGEKESYNTSYLAHLHDAHMKAAKEGNIKMTFIDWNKHRLLHDEDILEFCEKLL